MKMKPPDATCYIVGILDDGWTGLSSAARAALHAAGLVVGVGRALDLVRPHLVRDSATRDMDGALGAVPAWIADALAAGRTVAVLATGDPLCHGIAAYLIGVLGIECVEILPAPSTLQIAMARFKKPWQDAIVASCHGRDAGAWFIGATPAHGLYPLMRAVALNRCVLAFTSPENNPARLAHALLTAGYGDMLKLSVACRLLLPDEAVLVDLPVAVAATMAFPAPAVVLIERDGEVTPLRFGLEDSEYLQRTPENGLITKQEARTLSLAKLRLKPDAVVWDIGAGSGAVGLEAACLAPRGHVWAIEKNEDAAAHAHANAVRFRIGNYTLVTGRAPAFLAAWPDPDAVFVGGSGGDLAGLIRLILKRLKPNGRLVMNFIALENLATAMATLTESQAGWEVTQLQASRGRPILGMHRLAAQNPIWIITANKENS